MPPISFIHRRSRREGPRLDPDALGVELLGRLDGLDRAARSLAGGHDAPPGLDPDLYLAPGVPRVRPLLVLLCAQVARGDDALGDDSTQHVAAMVDLLHLAILVHDKALGQKGGRRRRAARRLLGGALGLLGGNHLTLRALELAQQVPAPEVVGDLLDAMREIADSQSMSESLEDRMASSDECLAHAEGNTGAVFSFACRAGARAVGGDRGVVHKLGRYGRHAGIAWHLAEDLATFDLQGQSLAQALDERARDGRPLLGLSLAIERDPSLVDLWDRFLDDGSPDTADDVAARVRRTGALSESRQRLTQAAWTARKALSDVTPSPQRDALDGLVAGLAC